MSERTKDELIDTQKQVIGILFEIIKRLQENNKLDEEYFQLITNDGKNANQEISHFHVHILGGNNLGGLIK